MRDLNVVLLHEGMRDKRGDRVTTSLTLIDSHDIARSCRTFSVSTFYIAHPSPSLRKLARTVKEHWESGFGAEYNPDRKEALSYIDISTSLDEVIHKIDLRTGTLPKLIATSAIAGSERIGFADMAAHLDDGAPYLLMLGTGYGMDADLLSRADYFLAPVEGVGDYNHLSVRSACAIMLDRLMTRAL